MLASAWKTIRTLSAQAAEGTSAPASSSGVDLGQAGARLEVRLTGASFGGAPNAVTLRVWRVAGSRVDLLGTVDILSGDIATPVPRLFELYDQHCYVTVASFSGGTSPTLTGTVEARVVFGS